MFNFVAAKLGEIRDQNQEKEKQTLEDEEEHGDVISKRVKTS